MSRTLSNENSFYICIILLHCYFVLGRSGNIRIVDPPEMGPAANNELSDFLYTY